MPLSFLLNTGKGVVSGLFRAFILSLLIAAFSFIPLQAQTAYVTNLGSNTVSAIDTTTNTVTATIPLATAPLGIVASTDGTRVYVGDINLGGGGGGAGSLFISSGPGGNVYVIDTSNNTVIRTIVLSNGEFASLLAITPDGNTLYGSNGNGDLFAIDIASGAITATIPGIASGGVAVTPDGATVYAANFHGSTVSAVSTATNTVTATIPVGANPGSIQLGITSDGAFVYVPNHGPNTVSVISTATNTVTATIPVGSSPSGAAVSPNGSFAYAANTGANSVSAITVPTNTVSATIHTSNFGPQGLAFTPDSAFVYIADENGTVDVIATATNTIVASIGGLSVPVSIAIAARPSQPPTAVAGANQSVTVEQTVHLDGSGSFAPDTKSANLQYAWSFVSRPVGSAAVLASANTATPSFVADVPGTFVVQLVVTDPATHLSSTPSQVTISSVWTPPMANAGTAQSVVAGNVVQLNGTGSSDPNGLSLSYAWSFVSKPAGSNATITPGTPGLASFTADVAGTYTVQLVVSDQFGSSQPSTVIITAITPDAFVEGKLHAAINYIAAMPCSHFDACGHRNALTNFLQQAIDDVQKGKISQAIGKVTDAIIRTDGFPLRGSVDGPGAGMDWIIDQTDQNAVYPLLKAALDELNKM